MGNKNFLTIYLQTESDMVTYLLLVLVYYACILLTVWFIGVAIFSKSCDLVMKPKPALKYACGYAFGSLVLFAFLHYN